MNYAQARDLIKDGDMIAVKRRNGLLPQLTRITTGSPYTHVGIAVWAQERLLVAQMNGGGNNLVPLSQFDEFSVFACPVDGECCAAVVWDELGRYESYSFSNLFFAAINVLFHGRIPPSRSGLICSGLVKHTYRACGCGALLPTIPTPRDLTDVLTLKFEVKQ